MIDLRLGTRTGSQQTDQDFLRSLAERGDALGSPSIFAYTLSTAALGEVAMALGLGGSIATISSGSIGGLASVVFGAAAVKSGRSAACLCGAMDVSGSEGDVLGLFLLEPAVGDVPAPRLVDWRLRFGPDGVGAPPATSLQATMEHLARVLSHGEGEVAASCPGGSSAFLTVSSEPRATTGQERLARPERL